MSDILEVFGEEYTGVNGFKATNNSNTVLSYIRPQGTTTVVENGTVDVSTYANVEVAVPMKNKKYTATISVSGTATFGSFYVEYGSHRYNEDSEFTFDTGDSIRIYGFGNQDAGVLYIDGVSVAGGAQTGFNYTYDVPSCDIEIDSVMGSQLRVYITTHPTVYATSKSVLTGFSTYNHKDELIEGQLDFGLEPTLVFYTADELRKTLEAHTFIPKYDNEMIVWNITGSKTATSGTYPYAYLLFINDGVPKSGAWIKCSSSTRPWDVSTYAVESKSYSITVDENGYLQFPSSGTWSTIAAGNIVSVYEIELPMVTADVYSTTITPSLDGVTGGEIRETIAANRIKPTYENSIIFWHTTGSVAPTIGNVTPYTYIFFMDHGVPRKDAWISGASCTAPWASTADFSLRNGTFSMDQDGYIVLPSSGAWGYTGENNNFVMYEFELPTVEGDPCSVNTTYKLQSKTVTPTKSTQKIKADDGYIGLGITTVNPIPDNYVDTSDATATEADVLHGKTFYDSTGARATGIATSVTGMVYQDSEGYVVFDDSGASDIPVWTRPEGWMPYAKGWTRSTFEGVYFVYDLINNKDSNNPDFWSLYFTTSPTTVGRVVLDTGYVNSSGVYVSSTSEVVNQGTVKTGFLPIWDGVTAHERYFVIRAIPATGCHITLANFNIPNATTWNERYGGTYTFQNSVHEKQPCIEIYGRLPYLQRISNNASDRSNRNQFVKHYYVVDIGKGGNLTGVNGLAAAFRYDYNLECVDGMDTWDISNATSFAYMFSDCPSLKSVSGLEDWDLSNITELNAMFNGCRSLVTVNGFSGKNVESVTTISSMFDSCHALRSLDLSNMEFSSALTNTNSVFRYCYSLNQLDISGWEVSPTTSSYTFQQCYNLEKIDLSGWDLSRVTTLQDFFNTARGPSKIEFDTGTSSALTNISGFLNNSDIRNLDFTGWNFSNVASNSGNGVANMYRLLTLKGFAMPVSFNISGNTMMQTDALVQILTDLPTVSTAQTITLGSTLLVRLTSAQIAIATEKGWTVA